MLTNYTPTEFTRELNSEVNAFDMTANFLSDAPAIVRARSAARTLIIDYFENYAQVAYRDLVERGAELLEEHKAGFEQYVHAIVEEQMEWGARMSAIREDEAASLAERPTEDGEVSESWTGC